MRFYRKNRLATQIQGAIQHTFFGHDEQLLAQQQRSGKRTETSLLATDQQGSVVHGVGGAGIESRAYNAYGHHPAESGLSCLMGFNGEQRDPVTGHYLLGNGYRAFNPVLMRFNSPDSLSPFGRGGLNAYAYCRGDPVNFRDPSGSIPVPSFTQKAARVFLRKTLFPALKRKRMVTPKAVLSKKTLQSRIVDDIFDLQDEIAKTGMPDPAKKSRAAAFSESDLRRWRSPGIKLPVSLDYKEIKKLSNSLSKLKQSHAFEVRVASTESASIRRVGGLFRAKSSVRKLRGLYAEEFAVSGGSGLYRKYADEIEMIDKAFLENYILHVEKYSSRGIVLG